MQENHNCHIRSAVVQDTDLLVDLMVQLGYPMSVDHMREQIQTFIEHPEFGHIWVAQKDDLVVGCISLSLMHWFHHHKGKFARITSLVVDQNYRRQGIGKMLVEFAENHARESGCIAIELTSGMHRSALGSHDFYTNLGYDDLSGIKKYMAKKF